MYQFLDSESVRKEKRLIWAVNRSVMENIGFALKKSGKKSKSHWDLFIGLLITNIYDDTILYYTTLTYTILTYAILCYAMLYKMRSITDLI